MDLVGRGEDDTIGLLAGDEIGNSQNGNNNAYAQDNEIAWINWAESDEEMLAFTTSPQSVATD